MVSSSSMEGKEPRNWLDLPPELMTSIFVKLGAAEVLLNAQRVCTAWRRISKDPSIWRKIDMRGSYGCYFGSICRNAVDRSEGGLVEINIGFFVDDSLLNYISDRSSNLTSLGLEMYYQETNNGLLDAITKLPLLEELEVSRLWSSLDLKAIGLSCPRMKSLKLNCSSYPNSLYEHDDDDALAISESMPELRCLQLIGNRLTNNGLNAILDKCPHLEDLDLRLCMNINLSGDLAKRCLERLKDFRRPDESIADYPYYDAFIDIDLYGGGDDTQAEYDFSGDSDIYSDEIFNLFE